MQSGEPFPIQQLRNLWRHDSGLPLTWELDGGSIIGYHTFDPVDPVWQVQP